MSREERRAYERQMKSMERGPALPPGAQARAERNAARRAARRGSPSSASAPGTSPGLRFWIRTVLIAVVAGFLGFSIQWTEGMPRALYVGLIVAAVTFLLVLGFRFLQGRVARAR